MVQIEPGNVLFQTAEDGLADTISWRLSDAGADQSRIWVVDESYQGLTLNDDRLRTAIEKLRPRLVVIDPLQAYLGADRDMHRANEVRPLLARLNLLAGEYKCAILLIGHQNKSTAGKGIYRGLGSIDIAAAARSVLVVGEAEGQRHRRAMVQIKSSLAPKGRAQLFDLDPETGFAWAGPSDLSEDEVLYPQAERRAPARKEAEAFLLEVLKDGRRRGTEIEREATELGIAHKTLRKARENLCKRPERGSGSDMAWYWELAPIYKQGQEGQQGQVALFHTD